MPELKIYMKKLQNGLHSTEEEICVKCIDQQFKLSPSEPEAATPSEQ
jgi:hypothetical protein